MRPALRGPIAALVFVCAALGRPASADAAGYKGPPAQFPLSAISVSDASFGNIAHVSDDGRVTNSSFKLVGHIKADATITDAAGNVIGSAINGYVYDVAGAYWGCVCGDGVIRNSANTIIGVVSSSGTIIDSHGVVVGHVGNYKANLNHEIAAIAWFFHEGRLALK